MTDFHKSVVYQCYFKSFYDTNGDGVGDLFRLQGDIHRV